jgi:hypothetical protein
MNIKKLVKIANRLDELGLTAAGRSLKGISEVMGRALKEKKDQAEINKINLEDDS